MIRYPSDRNQTIKTDPFNCQTGHTHTHKKGITNLYLAREIEKAERGKRIKWQYLDKRTRIYAGTNVRILK